MGIRQEVMFKELTIVRAESRGSRPHAQRFYYSIYVSYDSWLQFVAERKTLVKLDLRYPQ